MSTAYYDYSIDPVNNQIYPIILRSASKGGTTDYKIGVPDLTISAAANFPSTNTTTAPSRYFLELPMDSYYTSTNTTAFSVYNETQARALTVITPSASLTNYTCKFMNTGSERKSILEVHVGSTSNQASDVISYEGYFSGSILKSTTLDHVQLGSITFNSTSTVEGNIYQTAGYKIATNGEGSPDVDIGGLTLYSTANKHLSIKSVQSAHGITSVDETDTKFMIADAGAGGFGGIKIRAFSTRTEPLQFESYNAGSTSGGNSFVFDAYSSTGGADSTSISTADTLISYENKGVQVCKITGAGFFSSTNAGIITRSTFSAGFNPTNANIGTALGLSSVKPAGWVGVIGTTASTCYVVTTDGSSWYFIATMTRAT